MATQDEVLSALKSVGFEVSYKQLEVVLLVPLL